MALYHKWDVKNDFAYVLQFFSLISDSLGSVEGFMLQTSYLFSLYYPRIPSSNFYTTKVFASDSSTEADNLPFYYVLNFGAS